MEEENQQFHKPNDRRQLGGRSSIGEKRHKNFFAKKFKAQAGPIPRPDGVPFSLISNSDNCFLTAVFEKEEVKEAMWECSGEKSPGPDGYNFKFIKKLCCVLQNDFYRVLEEFHKQGTWPKGCNASFNPKGKFSRGA